MTCHRFISKNDKRPYNRSFMGCLLYVVGQNDFDSVGVSILIVSYSGRQYIGPYMQCTDNNFRA